MPDRLILASASPRRRDLLTAMGVVFEIVPSAVEETLDRALSPAANAERLAYEKAADVAQRFPDRSVLGADTIVVVGGKILGKPANRGEAAEMLRSLSGTRHRVITGVCLLGPGEKRRLEHEITWVTMRPITSEEIEAYLDSGEWEGKAGAYAIQETADRFVTQLEGGSFENVVGLPTALVRKMLADPAKSG